MARIEGYRDGAAAWGGSGAGGEAGTEPEADLGPTKFDGAQDAMVAYEEAGTEPRAILAPRKTSSRRVTRSAARAVANLTNGEDNGVGSDDHSDEDQGRPTAAP